MEIVPILLLVLVPVIVQLVLISVYYDRLSGAIRRSGDPPPYRNAVVIRAVGDQPRAVARLLDRATRLDLDEVDALIEDGGGRLPLRMSQPGAQRLVRDLRQLGADADTLREAA